MDAAGCRQECSCARRRAALRRADADPQLLSTAVRAGSITPHMIITYSIQRTPVMQRCTPGMPLCGSRPARHARPAPAFLPTPILSIPPCTGAGRRRASCAVLGLGARASRALRATALTTRSLRGACSGPLRAVAAKRRPDWPHLLPRATACRGPARTSWHVRPGLPCPGTSRRGRSDVAAA